MPLANCTTPANDSEPQQVISLLNSVIVRTNSPGRDSKRVKVLAADKGYDSKDLRAALRNSGGSFPRKTLRQRGIRPQLPKRTWFGEEKSG